MAIPGYNPAFANPNFAGASGYSPIMTPQQQMQFSLMQSINRESQPLSYQEWLASRGTGNPYAPVPQQQAGGVDLGSILGGAGAGEATNVGSAGSAGNIAMGGQGAGTVAPQTAGLASGYGIGLAPLAAVAGATILGGKSAYDMFRGKSDNSIPGKIGRVSLGVATGGLSEVGRHFLMHESTRDKQKKVTDKLQGRFTDDPTYQAYVKGMRDQFSSAPPDPSKPFHNGQYGSWEEYKKAGLDAGDLTGVEGNIDTFGQDWTKLNFDQQKAATQRMIDAGLYSSSKGGVQITDAAKARQIFDEASKTGFKPNPGNGQAANSKAPLTMSASKSPLMIPRVNSPGFKDGKRINYGAK